MYALGRPIRARLPKEAGFRPTERTAERPDEAFQTRMPIQQSQDIRAGSRPNALALTSVSAAEL